MSDEDIVLAFGLVLAGTISTSLGSILLFIGKFDNISYLSMILGFAAGALLYISLFEIIEKSVDSFAESLSNGDTESKYPTLAAVACFYLGMMTIVLVETIIHKLNPHDHNMKEMLESVRIIPPSSSSSSSSVEDNEHNHHHSHTTESQFSQHLLLPDDNNSGNINQSSPDITTRNNYRMKKMSAITAIAVALHNFPEGMATFAATLDDPSVGLSLTIAIIVHNLAVGICIAMPVYITTGSKLRAIGWVFFIIIIIFMYLSYMNLKFENHLWI